MKPVPQRKFFGTDGIRGTFGVEPMTVDFAFATGAALGRWLSRSDKISTVVIGRDTRASGALLEQALASGLDQEGVLVALTGVVPTAAISVATVAHRAAAGIMISASHNPHTDNGIKIFGADGFKLADETEAELENLIESEQSLPLGALTHGMSSNFQALAWALRLYEETLLKTLPSPFSLSGLKVIVDAANGAAWKTSPHLLQSLGAEVVVIHAKPDGTNINTNCGSQHPLSLQKAVREQGGGWIGLAHDGDADRLLMVDEEGRVLDGDDLLAIIGRHMQARGDLKNSRVVATVMSNAGLEESLGEVGVSVERSDVGDRYVMERMRATGAIFGGEQSGHLLFLDLMPTGDGLLSALQLFRVMKEEGRPLVELRKVLQKFPQLLVSQKVTVKTPFEQIPGLQEEIEQVERAMGGRGRVLLRYSGTENKARLLLEAAEAENLENWAEKILKPLRDSLCS
jgi:phosphoglucosamine mutase